MKILAIDTATEACSVALWIDGAVEERYVVEPRAHARLALPMAQSLLMEAGLTLNGLDAVAFDRGPGSFTGLRIAAGVAQGLAFALDLPTLAVSSLTAIAEGLRRTRAVERLFVAIDARMDEIYCGYCATGADGLMESRGAERVCAPTAIAPPPQAQAERWAGAGSGWGRHAAALGARLPTSAIYPDALPRAGDVARLGARDLANGGGLPAEQAQPVYLRNRVTGRGDGVAPPAAR